MIAEIDVAVLAVLMVFGIPLVAILGGLMLAALRILKGGSERASREQLEEETQLVQRLFHRLERMEERVEALETILVEREREERNR